LAAEWSPSTSHYTGEKSPVRLPFRRIPWHRREVVSRETKARWKKEWFGRVGALGNRQLCWAKTWWTIRFVIDFRAINAINTLHGGQIPLNTETSDSVKGSVFYTTLDRQSGYW
jgi:hypothetical protein